jgi:membrane protease subunit HflK
MLTTDENIIDIQYVVQYRLMPEGAPDYLFNTADPDESVRQAAETAMREVVGRKSMDFVLYEGRTEVAGEVQRLTQDILDRYRTGVQVSTVAIQNVQPPEQVQAAFDDAVKAGQDRERLINEGNAYANKILPETEGMVARMLQDAEGYRARVVGQAQGDAARFTSVEAEFTKAPKVTRERLYLSTMQEILSSTSKIMIDSTAGNNMLYLPLDKIMNQVSSGDRPANFSSTTEGRAAAGSAAGGSSPATPSGNSSTTRQVRPDSGASTTLMSPYSR